MDLLIDVDAQTAPTMDVEVDRTSYSFALLFDLSFKVVFGVLKPRFAFLLVCFWTMLESPRLIDIKYKSTHYDIFINFTVSGVKLRVMMFIE